MVVGLGALGVDLGAWGGGLGALGVDRREHESGRASAPAELYTIIPVGRCPPGQLPTHRPRRPLCYENWKT